jgi:Phosphotransferase enzyme family
MAELAGGVCSRRDVIGGGDPHTLGTRLASLMSTLYDQLRSSVAAEIRVQLGSAEVTRGGAVDPEIKALADELVKQALLAGHLGSVSVGKPKEFDGGNTAMLVGSLTASLDYVVKADRQPKVVAEAHLLQRVKTDPSLPDDTRKAFPSIYAISDAGPLFGYLMENLKDYTPLYKTLRVSADDASNVLSALWRKILAPAYRQTHTRRLPSIVEDYIGRVQERFREALKEGLIPAADAPLCIETGEERVEIPDGWGPLLERAGKRVAALAPAFGTFVHGDPNPENILWRENKDGEVVVRLIDPKEWWTGDYLFDVAKVGHYLRVTGPVEQHKPPASCKEIDGTTTVVYDAQALRINDKVESRFLTSVKTFAEDQGDGAKRDPTWSERYEFAIASNLLGIVQARAKRSSEKNETQRHLAWIAFGEGLRLLHHRVHA